VKWKEIEESGFSNGWNFSRCCGATDGKHCNADIFVSNRIILMSVLHHKCCSLYIDIGSNELVCDEGSFADVIYFQLLEIICYQMEGLS
jgi:hypothetical protein